MHLLYVVSAAVPQRSPRFGTGWLTLVQNQLTIDDHEFDPFAVRKRLLISRFVDDSIWCEDGYVRKGACRERSPVRNAKLGRVERGHLAHRILEPQQTPLANIDTEHARERPEVSRMR